MRSLRLTYMSRLQDDP